MTDDSQTVLSRFSQMVPALDTAALPKESLYSEPRLPCNIEAEQALLGAILYDNAAFERLQDLLAPLHFYEPLHQRLFSTMQNLIRKGQLAEPIILQEYFRQDPGFEALGGVRYLADLLERSPAIANVPDYGRVIYDLALRRDLIRLGGDVTLSASKDVTVSARDQIEIAEQKLFHLAESGAATTSGFIPFSTAVKDAVSLAAAAFGRDGGLAGLSTGLIDLDNKLGGLHPSDLIILAGRPSMGKTSLATNIAYHAARHYEWKMEDSGARKTMNGGVVAFFSLEMSAEQLAMRLLAEVSGIASDRLRKGDITASEFAQIRDAAVAIQDCPLYIDATGGLSLAKLSARARRLKRQPQGLDLIIVDYLQLVTASEGRRGEGRVQEVSEVTMGLKALAKDLSVPVIALSQLSRQVENREDKRPQLADLRESGSIEQDADAVIFVYREAYYKGRTEPTLNTPEHYAWQEEMDKIRHVAELIIGKQRHGPIGTVKVSFNEELTQFGNLAKEGRY